VQDAARPGVALDDRSRAVGHAPPLASGEGRDPGRAIALAGSVLAGLLPTSR
jgi:hypothetical protein